MKSQKACSCCETRLSIKVSQPEQAFIKTSSSELFEYALPAGPSFVVGLLVCLFVRVGGSRVFARAHEAVARAFISHRLVGLACLFHQVSRLGHCRRHASVVAAVEAINGGLDLRNRLFAVRPRAVE